MKALLICPADRSAVSHLSDIVPLALLPILGRSLIEYWLEHLASSGVVEVLILSSDRPHLIRQAIEGGCRWGLKVQVLPEHSELSVAEARAKYIHDCGKKWSEPNAAILMDHLPGLPDNQLFESYSAWFEALQAWMSYARTPSRIGVRELQPGIWVGQGSRIPSTAQLRAPCWIGNNVWVGPETVIGPRVVLEDGVFVDQAAHVSESLVGPETFIGKLIELRHSLAWKNNLLDWTTGSWTQVPDRLLLSGLSENEARPIRAGFLGRVTALMVLLASWPIGFAAILRSLWGNHPAFRSCRAVYPQGALSDVRLCEITYYELTGAGPWLKRWPQLWNIVLGEFAWVGNRPLTRAQASMLGNDFERLWLETPAGLFSLADARGCIDSFSDESRAHASFYAARRSWLLNLQIMCRAVSRAFFGMEPSEPTPVEDSVVKEKALSGNA